MSRWRSRGRRGDYGGWGGFAPYVPVAERRAKAEQEAKKAAKKGTVFSPVRLTGRTIASSFWGRAWCDNLESYSDFANRMPRGRSYVRNGSVLHLDIQPGTVEALVSGSSLYRIKVGFKPVDKAKWERLCRDCAGGIGSLMELLAGRLSESVMGVMTKKETGLFPAPSEIELHCSCPDWADMCKHVAAVLYGVGARLDEKPELLFTLRQADHRELVAQAAAVETLTEGTGKGAAPTLKQEEVASVFGIELEAETPVVTAKPAAQETAPAKPERRKRAKPAVHEKTPAKPDKRKRVKQPVKPVVKRKARGRPGTAGKVRKAGKPSEPVV